MSHPPSKKENTDLEEELGLEVLRRQRVRVLPGGETTGYEPLEREREKERENDRDRERERERER